MISGALGCKSMGLVNPTCLVVSCRARGTGGGYCPGGSFPPPAVVQAMLAQERANFIDPPAAPAGADAAAPEDRWQEEEEEAAQGVVDEPARRRFMTIVSDSEDEGEPDAARGTHACTDEEEGEAARGACAPPVSDPAPLPLEPSPEPSWGGWELDD